MELLQTLYRNPSQNKQTMVKNCCLNVNSQLIQLHRSPGSRTSSKSHLGVRNAYYIYSTRLIHAIRRTKEFLLLILIGQIDGFNF